MPTFVILATADSGLADAWERQLPAGRIVMRLGGHSFSSGAGHGISAVVVLDAVAEASLPPALTRCPTIFIGEPRSFPFEQARMAGRAKVYLSYEESVKRLGEFLPLVEELAEKSSLVEMLAERHRRMEPVRPAQARQSITDGTELWDFVEGAIENLDTRERLLSEFRRASRHLLRASHAVFFLRDPDGFRADRGTSFFASDDPLVGYFESHPAVVDGTDFELPAQAVAELAIRNRLAMWGARMLVPVHDNGRLLGLIALGVREDGQPYDEGDRTRAVFFARLLRHLLGKSDQLGRLTHVSEQLSLGAKYLPSTLVLGRDENAPRHVPLVVREAIGQARKTRELCQVRPTFDQPFRVSAGIIAETGGVWVFWQEASGEVHEAFARERAGRREVLREIALTLSHELGNALVSLAIFRQIGPERAMPAALIETMKNDVVQLERLNDNLAVMQSLHEGEASPVDVRDLAQQIGDSLGLPVEVGPNPVPLIASRKLLEFALRSLIQTVGENRPDAGLKEITLRVRSTGFGADTTALLSLKGKRLELEGILPEPVDGAVPNQGRMRVFLAKEILKLHHGEIHAGPGIEGTEILISLRQWSMSAASS